MNNVTLTGKISRGQTGSREPVIDIRTGKKALKQVYVKMNHIFGLRNLETPRTVNLATTGKYGIGSDCTTGVDAGDASLNSKGGE